MTAPKQANFLIEQVQNCLRQYQLIHHDYTLLLAFSGGSDSSCLLHLLATLQQLLKFKLVAAHLDHAWYAGSAQDAQHCVRICQQYQVPIILGHATDWQHKIGKNRSLEAQYRAMRQQFLLAHQHKISARAILTAHHAGDQLETFFIRLMRGAGVAGLAAMHAYNAPWLRPLLACDKLAIQQYLQQNQITFLVDSSNYDEKFLRNRLRQRLLPLLNQIDERAGKKILDCIAILQQENSVLDELARGPLLYSKTSSAVLELSKFKALPPILQSRCVVQLLVANQARFTVTHAFLQQACKFINSTAKNHHCMGQYWCFHKQNGQLEVVPRGAFCHLHK